MSGKEGYPAQNPQPMAQAAPPYPMNQQSGPQVVTMQTGYPAMTMQTGYPVMNMPQVAYVDPMAAMAVAQGYNNQMLALCEQGNHAQVTRYGMFGWIMAIMCFPCGLICLMNDKEERCARCGILLSPPKK